MPIARRWLRDSLRASAVTLLVPGAVLAALLAAALGSGFGGLGSLGQLVGGPALPVGTRVAAPTRPHAARLPVVPVTATPAAAPRPASAPAGAVGRATTPAVGAPVAGARPRRPRPAPVRTPASVGAPTPASSGAGASAPSSGSPGPAQPGTLHRAVAPVQSAVASAPAPVGPAASDAVGTVVDLVEPGGATGAARALPVR
jgi:hypothetical protein